MENSHKIDIDSIIELVKNQEPDRPELITALRNSKNGYWSSKGYYRFVDSKNANEKGAEWQHDECIVLEQETESDIVLDMLKDGRVGGIEFIGLIEQ